MRCRRRALAALACLCGALALQGCAWQKERQGQAQPDAAASARPMEAGSAALAYLGSPDGVKFAGSEGGFAKTCFVGFDEGGEALAYESARACSSEKLAKKMLDLSKNPNGSVAAASDLSADACLAWRRPAKGSEKGFAPAVFGTAALWLDKLAADELAAQSAWHEISHCAGGKRAAGAAWWQRLSEESRADAQGAMLAVEHGADRKALARALRHLAAARFASLALKGDAAHYDSELLVEIAAALESEGGQDGLRESIGKALARWAPGAARAAELAAFAQAMADGPGQEDCEAKLARAVKTGLGKAWEDYGLTLRGYCGRF